MNANETPLLSEAVLQALAGLRDLQVPRAFPGAETAQTTMSSLVWVGGLALLSFLLIYFWHHRRPRTRVKRSIERLRKQYAQHQDAHALATGLSQQLREAGQRYFGSSTAGVNPPFSPGLSGAPWLDFLAAHAPAGDGEAFQQGLGRLLNAWVYSTSLATSAPPEQGAALIALCERWLRHAARRSGTA